MFKLKCQTVLFITTCFAAMGTLSAAVETPAQNTSSPSTDEVNISLLSEAFGHFIGKNLKSPGVTFDVEAVIRGIRNGAAGKPAPMNDQEYEAAMSKLQERAFSALSEQNLKSAKEFLEKNASEPGIKEIEAGKLQYQVLTPGTGEEIKPHSSPLINYTGRYQDGTVFGSSEEVGGPITIPLDQTIPGFSKGLLGMKEGEKRKLFIHPDLGYGTMGNLPPNALLIFDIEVVKANSAELNPQDGEKKGLGLEDDDDDDEKHNDKHY